MLRKTAEWGSRLRDSVLAFVEAQRIDLARQEAVLQLAVLAVAVGAISGGLIIVFRLLVEGAILAAYLPEYSDSFEALKPLTRLLLCIGGGLLVGAVFSLAAPASREVGIVHVIERMAYHQSDLPVKNAAMQYLGAALSIATGQSVGREGPNVHIGAASGSLVARYLHIPNNASRTLIGCGVAAAIGAGFNTPLAGVVFAMEVVLMEYTILGFTPIILAAVVATSLSRLVFGESPAFEVPALEWSSVAELPYVLFMGVLIGFMAALFIKSTMWFASLLKNAPYVLRTTLAGAIAGGLALLAPEIMGVGYDTVSATLLGQIPLYVLLLILAAKFLATSSAIGLGIPGGLIGPTLVLGACAGGAMGMIGNHFAPEIATPGFYALLGMGAMMGATLQSPLTALVSMLELTANHSVILPGMIAVISAVLTKRGVFRMLSIYQLLMRARGLDYRNSPMAQALRRIGVASVMDKNIVQQQAEISRQTAESVLDQEARWIMVLTDEHQASVIPASDLAIYLNDSEDETISLLEIPAMRENSIQITMRATLQEAYETMQNTGAKVLHVCGTHRRGRDTIYGVITREHIERSYHG